MTTASAIGYSQAYRARQQAGDITAQAAVEFAQAVEHDAIAAQARRLAAPVVEQTQQVSLETSQQRDTLVWAALAGLALIGLGYVWLRGRP